MFCLRIAVLRRTHLLLYAVLCLRLTVYATNPKLGTKTAWCDHNCLLDRDFLVPLVTGARFRFRSSLAYVGSSLFMRSAQMTAAVSLIDTKTLEVSRCFHCSSLHLSVVSDIDW